jgi:NADPH:quinone reductase-like Zn-dependent oxidoreductase
LLAYHLPAAAEQPRLAELPVPPIQPGHVLVKVKAAGLNPLDNAIASGVVARVMPHHYPVVLGRDAAGVIEATGDGVEGLAAGDEVLAHIPLAPPIASGTLAEYVLVAAANVALKPASLDFVTAAALPLSAGAAMVAVEAIDPRPGDAVLVNGASGGVGSFAVQLLAARDTVVVATGTEADVERLIKLGATTVVDYTRESVAKQVRLNYPGGVHALINLAGHTADMVPLAAVATGGKVVTATMAPDADTLAAAGLTGTSIMTRPDGETLRLLAEQVATGTLSVEIDTVLPLRQVADGLATLASGQAHGKIVITVDA